jgi:hypothetical protein
LIRSGQGAGRTAFLLPLATPTPGRDPARIRFGR